MVEKKRLDKKNQRKESAHISNKSTTHLVFKQPVIIATLSFRAMSTYFVVSNDMVHSIYRVGHKSLNAEATASYVFVCQKTNVLFMVS